MKTKNPKTSNAKPKTPRGWALYRIGLNCSLGKQALDGEAQVPECCNKTDYALYCLLNAIEDIAVAMKEEK